MKYFLYINWVSLSYDIASYFRDWWSQLCFLHILECTSLKSLVCDRILNEWETFPSVVFVHNALEGVSLGSMSTTIELELETLMYSCCQLEIINIHMCSRLFSKVFSWICFNYSMQFLDLRNTSVDDFSLATIANGAKMLKSKIVFSAIKWLIWRSYRILVHWSIYRSTIMIGPWISCFQL